MLCLLIQVFGNLLIRCKNRRGGKLDNKIVDAVFIDAE